MRQVLFFSVSMLILLAYPIYMVYEQETILSRGEVYKFKLEPVDPIDAFRGRYLNLNYSNRKIPADTSLNSYDNAYVVVKKGVDGFAVFDRFEAKRPDETHFAGYLYYVSSDHKARVTMPNNLRKYYLNEELAPLAEKVVQEFTDNDSIPAYAEIVIYNGQASLKEIYLDQRPIVDFLRDYQKTQPKTPSDR